NWLKLHDRRPVYAEMSDKYAAREFIRKHIGEQYLIPLLGVWDDADKIDFDALPDRFVLKATHDSGSVRVVTDKSAKTVETLRDFYRKRLKKRYYMMWRERQYEHVTPRVIAEQYMTGKDGGLPADYKFFCFDGVMRIMMVCTELEDNVRYWFFDRDRKPLPCTDFMQSEGDVAWDWPEETDEMVRLAEELSCGLPCLRVDFLLTADGVKAGEMTLYHGSGMREYYADGWDEILGRYITVI
ncbi:MAG: ATP-grasp fold amidoligase family protein, partial [Christensenellales bacterium]